MPKVLTNKFSLVFILSFFLLISTLILSPKKVFANCTVQRTYQCSGTGAIEACYNDSTGQQSGGIAVYNCVTDAFGNTTCTCQAYNCTSPCSGGGGGGNNTCGGAYPSCHGSCSGGKTCKAQKPSVQDPKGKCGCTGGGSPPPSCTAPSTPTVTVNSPTSVTINWTPGTNTISQSVYIGRNKAEVTAGCPTGSSCVVKVQGIVNTATSYTASIPSTGDYYYVMVTDSTSCGAKNSAIAGFVSSCAINPTSLNLRVGDSQTLTVNLNNLTGTVGFVNVGFTTKTTDTYTAVCNPGWSAVQCAAQPGCVFSAGRCTSSGPITTNLANSVSLNPTTDASYFYQTQVTGVTANSNAQPGHNVQTKITATVNNLSCTNSINVAVSPPGPWWQTKDADVAANGDITSGVPSNNFFNLNGTGEFPGVVSYSGNATFSPGSVATPAWQANTAIDTSKVYNSAFFANQIPSDTVINTISDNSVDGTYFTTNGAISSDGYYWYKYDGSVSGLPFVIASDASLGDRKVVLLVDNADLDIVGNINLNKGIGFFMTVVGADSTGNGGNILVDPAVGGGAAPNLEGIYIADGQVSTGQAATELWVRGSVTGYGGVALDRDLGVADGTTPAELFEYAPDQVMLFPKELGVRKISWKEVAP